jgi:hypothetical protein
LCENDKNAGFPKMQYGAFVDENHQTKTNQQNY